MPGFSHASFYHVQIPRWGNICWRFSDAGNLTSTCTAGRALNQTRENTALPPQRHTSLVVQDGLVLDNGDLHLSHIKEFSAGQHCLAAVFLQSGPRPFPSLHSPPHEALHILKLLLRVSWG